MDVNGGLLPQPNGSPIFPGNHFTGPLLAGNVPHTSGAVPNAPAEAGLGGSIGLANTGYAVMAQSAVVNQNATSPIATPIVLPAQSQILRITMMTTAAFTGAATTIAISQLGGGAADLVSLTAVTAIGPHSLVPASGPQIGLWDNIGNQDMQITVLPANTGTGVGTLCVEYIQGINNAS